ncbi:exocyst complex component EXO70C1-like [Musa acuminata AAA Group]|uniref:exocyst complex component EXO70C1-like n=1 Tax=Musa acuminata AAA Group TaxID=214697 RepID=UPI0031D1F3DB
MEGNQPRLAQKSSSFTASRDEKHHEIDRNLSLGSLKLEQYGKRVTHGVDTIEEEETEEKPIAGNAEEPQASFFFISENIDVFLTVLLSVEEDGRDESREPPDIPEPTVERFVTLLEKEIGRYESGEAKWCSDNDEFPLLDAIGRVSKLTVAVTRFSSDTRYNQAMNRAGGVLHHAMCFLEDEFHSLLQDPRAKHDAGSISLKAKRQPSFSLNHDPDRSVRPSSESISGESRPPYPPETVERLHGIADAMISAGYDIECCQLFAIARHNAFEAGLPSLGFDKVSIEDVLKRAWDSLQSEIATWIKAFRHTITASFAAERDLCEAVFAGHPAVSDRLFRRFARGATVQLITFAEAVSMTKRSAEKLFKVLDIYEALRDVTPAVDALLPEGAEQDESSIIADPKAEIASVRCRLGEAAVGIFCDLESSIKADSSKTPVPGGAVHPLTRYVMNYLKYACEYKNTLEQVFKEHKHSEKTSSCAADGEAARGGGNGRNGSNGEGHNPFAAQLMEAMNLLHSNLESKSRLYKDQALCNIFLMNNGRYIAKKVKGSPEIHQLLGETWYRKRSSELRQYHKNYQRETWSRVLACLRDDGLQAKGSVAKPVLKERFKSFNAMIEETHKAQSSWVVSDEQLQSELRVSVSAVVVPAYRSFLGRFSQYLDPGRQTEKYIKFGPDDLETLIDELFDGNPSSTASKRRP